MTRNPHVPYALIERGRPRRHLDSDYRLSSAQLGQNQTQNLRLEYICWSVKPSEGSAVYCRATAQQHLTPHELSTSSSSPLFWPYLLCQQTEQKLMLSYSSCNSSRQQHSGILGRNRSAICATCITFSDTVLSDVDATDRARKVPNVLALSITSIGLGFNINTEGGQRPRKLLIQTSGLKEGDVDTSYGRARSCRIIGRRLAKNCAISQCLARSWCTGLLES